jgi:hypothetical protein
MQVQRCRVTLYYIVVEVYIGTPRYLASLYAAVWATPIVETVKNSYGAF